MVVDVQLSLFRAHFFSALLPNSTLPTPQMLASSVLRSSLTGGGCPGWQSTPRDSPIAIIDSGSCNGVFRGAPVRSLANLSLSVSTHARNVSSQTQHSKR
jgi:hypothetical protein